MPAYSGANISAHVARQIRTVFSTGASRAPLILRFLFMVLSPFALGRDQERGLYFCGFWAYFS